MKLLKGCRQTSMWGLGGGLHTFELKDAQYVLGVAAELLAVGFVGLRTWRCI